jgi:hypothetical protein
METHSPLSLLTASLFRIHPPPAQATIEFLSGKLTQENRKMGPDIRDSPNAGLCQVTTRRPVVHKPYPLCRAACQPRVSLSVNNKGTQQLPGNTATSTEKEGISKVLGDTAPTKQKQRMLFFRKEVLILLKV